MITSCSFSSALQATFRLVLTSSAYSVLAPTTSPAFSCFGGKAEDLVASEGWSGESRGESSKGVEFDEMSSDDWDEFPGLIKTLNIPRFYCNLIINNDNDNDGAITIKLCSLCKDGLNQEKFHIEVQLTPIEIVGSVGLAGGYNQNNIFKLNHSRFIKSFQ